MRGHGRPADDVGMQFRRAAPALLAAAIVVAVALVLIAVAALLLS